jgi:hypothetical protein
MPPDKKRKPLLSRDERDAVRLAIQALEGCCGTGTLKPSFMCRVYAIDSLKQLLRMRKE